MADQELAPQDLSTYTRGRLAPDDPNTVSVLARALQQVRNYCKWPVCPVIDNDVVKLDGPGQWGGYGVGVGSVYGSSYHTGTLTHRRVGSGTLFLPTKRLQGITSIVEDGVALDLSTIQWSEAGFVQKQNMQPWSSNLGAIEVTYTHGWSVDEAQDWRQIVLAVADRMSMVRGLIGPFPTEIGPYHMGAFYGTSRAGNMPISATWLDDLYAMIDTKRYVIEEI